MLRPALLVLICLATRAGSDCSLPIPAADRPLNSAPPTVENQLSNRNSYYTCDLGYKSSASTSTAYNPPFEQCFVSSPDYWQSSNINCDQITNYCNSATVPTLANANTPTPIRTVGQNTYFTCNDGYQSSGGTGTTNQPYYTCHAFTADAGVFSPGVTYSCDVYSGYYTSPYPALSNANTPTPVTYLNGVTYYTCDQGYQSTLTAGAAPYYTCTLDTAASGKWASYGLCNAIAAYCSAATAPTLANANTPTPVTSVNGITTFTCNSGYASNGPTAPYYQCLPDTATTGIWTAGVIYSCELIAAYCSAATAPTLANANTPTPVTTINARTYFTCNEGYVSSAGAGFANAPYYTCSLDSPTAGMWTGPTHTCTRMLERSHLRI